MIAIYAFFWEFFVEELRHAVAVVYAIAREHVIDAGARASACKRI